MLKEAFWQSPMASSLTSEMRRLKDDIGSLPQYDLAAKDLTDFAALMDDTMTAQLSEDACRLEAEIAKIEDGLAFSGPDDSRNAFLTIKCGAGGVEAQDWAHMVMRMYIKWCDIRGFKTELVDIAEKDIGIASAVIKVIGHRAYGLLKGERGCHKMARYSPYGKGAGQIRQTSFAGVEIEPEADEVGEIEIPEKDIERGVCRGSGPGGQGINRTDSVVMLKHLPTGLRVRCQNTRSQHENGIIAMELLKAKIKRLLEQQKEDKSKPVISAGFGSEYVRVYCIEPEPRVTDNRTGVKTTHVIDVLEGGLDQFLSA
jgi:peptide chain release factor 2